VDDEAGFWRRIDALTARLNDGPEHNPGAGELRAARQVYADWLQERGRAEDAAAQRWLAGKGKFPRRFGGGSWTWTAGGRPEEPQDLPRSLFGRLSSRHRPRGGRDAHYPCPREAELDVARALRAWLRGDDGFRPRIDDLVGMLNSCRVGDLEADDAVGELGRTRLEYADWLEERGRHDEALGQRWQAGAGKYPLRYGGRFPWVWYSSGAARPGALPGSLFGRLTKANRPQGRGYAAYRSRSCGPAERDLARALQALRSAPPGRPGCSAADFAGGGAVQDGRQGRARGGAVPGALAGPPLLSLKATEQSLPLTGGPTIGAGAPLRRTATQNP